MRRLRTFTISLAVLLCATARADTIYLATGNSGISGYPGNYAQVDITLASSTTAHLTFTGLQGYLIGDSGAADLNVNAGAFTVSNFSSSNPNTVFVSWGSGQVDGFGDFNLTTKLKDGWALATTALSFDIARTDGTWSSAADVLFENANHSMAAAHIYVPDPPGSGAIATGYAAGTSGSAPPIEVVPEPTGMLLIGVGLLFMAKLARRRLPN